MKSDLDLTESKTNLAGWFDNKNCVCQFDYIVNLISKFNKLNLQYQNFDKNTYKAHTTSSVRNHILFNYLNSTHNFRS